MTEEFQYSRTEARELIDGLTNRSTNDEVIAACKLAACEPVPLDREDMIGNIIANASGGNSERKKAIRRTFEHFVKEAGAGKAEKDDKPTAASPFDPQTPEMAIHHRDWLPVCVQARLEGHQQIDTGQLAEVARDAGQSVEFERDNAMADAVQASREALEAAWPKTGYTMRIALDGTVYVHETRGKGDDAPVCKVVCSPFILDGKAKRHDGHGWVLVFRVRGDDRTWSKVVIPQRELAARGSWEQALKDAGMRIPEPAVLLKLLQNMRAARTLRVVERGGWQDDTWSSFVLGREVIARADADEVVVPDGEDFSPKGTLDEWMEHVAAKAVGNQIIAYRMLNCLMAPAKRICGVQSGGSHVYIDTKEGKTATAAAAFSVIGAPGKRDPWNMSPAAFYRRAERRNDLAVWMDDTANRSSGRDSVEAIAAITYAAGNSKEAARAKSDGTERRQAEFHIELMSDGEESIQATFEHAKVAYKGGQESRLPNLPFVRVTALHGAKDETAFLEQLWIACGEYHGTAIREVIRLLMEPEVRRNLVERMNELRAKFVVPEDDRQEKDVAKRFALGAAVGELCIAQGILPWQPGYAIEVMQAAFQGWIGVRGKGALHVINGRKSLATYLQTFGGRRFDEIRRGHDPEHLANPHKGYRKSVTHGGHRFVEFIVPSDQDSVLKEMTGVENFADVIADLEELTLAAIRRWGDAEFERPVVMLLTPRTLKAFAGEEPSGKGLTVKREGGRLVRRACYVFLMELAVVGAAMVRPGASDADGDAEPPIPSGRGQGGDGNVLH